MANLTHPDARPAAHIQSARDESALVPDCHDRPESDLESMIKHAAHYLPAQGPITSFVHHNTLEAFETLPFDQAVVTASRFYDCQPYLAEDAYRDCLTRDRIRIADLEKIIKENLQEGADEEIVGLCRRIDFRIAMLRHPLRAGPDAELRWFVAETDALNRFRSDIPAEVRQRVVDGTRHWVMRDLRNGQGAGRPERKALEGLFNQLDESSIEHWSDSTWESFTLRALWRACRDGVRSVARPDSQPGTKVRHRDLLYDATGADSDRLINDLLIPFCAAFVDQGLAACELPRRDEGFYRAFVSVYGKVAPASRWYRDLARELKSLEAAATNPCDIIATVLESLGVEPNEQQEYITGTLLALRGWAGMIWQLETRSERAVRAVPAGSLVEYVAVRLILERLALRHLAQSLGIDGQLDQLRDAAKARRASAHPGRVERRAFLAFQMCQAMGWTPEMMFQLSSEQWSTLIDEIEGFPSLERRRVFHAAFERRYYVAALDAYASHCCVAPDRTELPRPRFQLFCCIDDREESFRRHLEEVASDVETFGAAGFFNVPIFYRGAADAHFAPLCPVVMMPKHWVVEDVAFNFEDQHRRRTRTRRALGALARWLHIDSLTFTRGIVASLLGSTATAPLVARVLFPRFTSQLGKLFGRMVEPPPVRQLVIERSSPTPGPEEGHIGFTVPEMATCVENLLRDNGLISNFARLVIITGHGSSSLNNPHESAYCCGACAGARGGPTARAFAQMANDPRVRSLVARNGIEIPSDTVFMGAYHNTCDDNVTYYDVDRLPMSHKTDFAEAKRDIDIARERNAHERCRRFDSAPLNLSPAAALRHVEARAEDLAQTRPEYNHATNALTYVGRRHRTRGLFLDRRTFLTSYDPTQDDAEHNILARVLKPAIPVCAGIGLEYYFSCVDVEGYGCDTKLSHNVSAMIGVMLGAAGDLRTGLNKQMIEIHEPVRQLFIIETTPEAMLSIMDRNPQIGTLCRNEWVHLATLSPTSSEIHLFKNGKFEPYVPESSELPTVGSSLDWYRGWRDHLGFAVVKPQDRPASSSERNLKQ